MAQTVKHLPTMWKTRVQSLGREDPLEKEMATHSRTLAWKIPWTEERGRLQSMGSQRVGHDWATSLTHVAYQMQECWRQDVFSLKKKFPWWTIMTQILSFQLSVLIHLCWWETQWRGFLRRKASNIKPRVKFSLLINWDDSPATGSFCVSVSSCVQKG